MKYHGSPILLFPRTMAFPSLILKRVTLIIVIVIKQQGSYRKNLKNMKFKLHFNQDLGLKSG